MSNTPTEENENSEIAENVEQQAEPDTITLEIPVEELHHGMRERLLDGGVDVEAQLAQRLAPQAENALHEMYQQGRYSQQ